MRAAILLFLALPLGASAGASDGLADAEAVRRLLGPGAWAKVVRIDNEGERGLEVRRPYPATVYGVIFEFGGILWFYCDSAGTQSLSTRRGAIASDKADPGPLFRAISVHFRSWAWVEEPGLIASRLGRGTPPNACFVECIALLRQRTESGREARAPTLLTYYISTAYGLLGHTVLVFGAGDGLAAVDPDRPSTTVRIPREAAVSIDALSTFIRGGEVATSRVLSVERSDASRPPAAWSAAVARGAPAT